MGRRGPAPKPSVIVELEGNRGHRRMNPQEVKPDPVAPRCPSWLHPYAKKEWVRMAPVLTKLNLLTEADGAAFAGYCSAHAMWRQAAEALGMDDDLTTTTPNGFAQPRPEIAIMTRAMELVKRFCQEFGMTPSARARMQVPQLPKEAEGMERLLG